MLQEPAACFRILGLGYRVLDVCFLETVKGDDYTVDFGKGVVEVPLFGGELDFLCWRISLVWARAGRAAGAREYLIEIDRRGEGGIGYVAVRAGGVGWLAGRFVHAARRWSWIV